MLEQQARCWLYSNSSWRMWLGFLLGTSVCVCVCACVYMYVHVRARGRARVRLCVHLHVRACACVGVDVGVCVCVCSIQRFTLLLFPLFFRLKINADVNVFVICIPDDCQRDAYPNTHAPTPVSVPPLGRLAGGQHLYSSFFLTATKMGGVAKAIFFYFCLAQISHCIRDWQRQRKKGRSGAR